MAIHESSINFRNLIRNLAEMYPFDVAEVVVVELVANSLDAKATSIAIEYEPGRKVLTVEDDGNGMDPAQFEEYHDFAAGLKARGTGIGFAGLGAKISFNIAHSVITETVGKSLTSGSNWYLQKKKLMWEDIDPARLRDHGTRVEVHFRSDAKIPYSSADDLTELLRRHYLPLLDSKYLHLYDELGFYSRDLRFSVNGRVVTPSRVREEFELDNIVEFYPMKSGKRLGMGILGVAASENPVAPGVCGVLLCTHGKVIKPEFFNQFPGDIGPRIFGMVEIPEFINFLTTAKTDFTRLGRHRAFERIYDPVRQEFKGWLKNLGVKTTEVEESDEAIRLEKEIKKLAEDIPELSEFFGFRSTKKILASNGNGPVKAEIQEGTETTFPVGKGRKGEGPGPVDVGGDPGDALQEHKDGTDKAKPISRTARRGPRITFSKTPDRVDLAWVDGNIVVINVGHPSYGRVRSNTIARRLHCIFAIASAVQRFLGTDSETPDWMFTDRMMAAWGKK